VKCSTGNLIHGRVGIDIKRSFSVQRIIAGEIDSIVWWIVISAPTSTDPNARVVANVYASSVDRDEGRVHLGIALPIDSSKFGAFCGCHYGQECDRAAWCRMTGNIERIAHLVKSVSEWLVAGHSELWPLTRFAALVRRFDVKLDYGSIRLGR